MKEAWVKIEFKKHLFLDNFTIEDIVQKLFCLCKDSDTIKESIMTNPINIDAAKKAIEEIIIEHYFWDLEEYNYTSTITIEVDYSEDELVEIIKKTRKEFQKEKEAGYAFDHLSIGEQVYVEGSWLQVVGKTANKIYTIPVDAYGESNKYTIPSSISKERFLEGISKRKE